ncbi:hypothetical protein MAR_008944 [Mya arenaria]|uniref:Uncharacterized protein n=1 Tax=Mya arenaria TaxID=6604 RepID=A0ABY7E1J7_MYAAR|nr:hypothetical protein MAR_008944 [Mya arenaria]
MSGFVRRKAKEMCRFVRHVAKEMSGFVRRVDKEMSRFVRRVAKEMCGFVRLHTVPGQFTDRLPDIGAVFGACLDKQGTVFLEINGENMSRRRRLHGVDNFLTYFYEKPQHQTTEQSTG